MSKNLVGMYHTHGYSNTDEFEEFSYYDKIKMEQEGVTGYLGTPQGGNKVKKYTPVKPPLISKNKVGDVIDSNYIELLKKMGYLSEIE